MNISAGRLTVLSCLLLSITQVDPIWADLHSRMARIPDLANVTIEIRVGLNADYCILGWISLWAQMEVLSEDMPAAYTSEFFIWGCL